jgi:hypothetical protein
VNKGDLAAIRGRLEGAAWPYQQDASGLKVKDASGNAILFKA